MRLILWKNAEHWGRVFTRQKKDYGWRTLAGQIKKTRDASWPGEDAPCETLPNNIRQAIVQIKECIDQERQFPEISMEVVDDLLINSPYR